MSLYPIMLAGGSGTRLWPLSRELYPKQFLPLTGKLTLFQETLSRLEGIEEVAPPIIVCNEAHRFLVAEQARDFCKAPPTIILEPLGRNTAPALTLAALSLEESCQRSDPDPVMLVMPADHLIRDLAGFQAAIKQGCTLAECGHLVTFGIVPKGPETGYGYIKKGESFDPVAAKASAEKSPILPLYSDGARLPHPDVTPHRVAAFVEKPDLATAQQYVHSRQYLWNSGIFMMWASVWLEQLGRYRPDIMEACRAAYAQGQWDGMFYRPDGDAFNACPSDSIDLAVMEKVAGKSIEDGTTAALFMPDGSPCTPASCSVLPIDIGWSDLGSWSALWEEGDQDAQGNVVQGDVYSHSMRDALLVAQHRLLAAVGLENVIVVETADAVLVAHRDSVQEVKEIVNRLKAEQRVEHLDHRKVHRPWGSYEVLDAGPRFQVKRLIVNPGAALSLQMHYHRAEHWVVVRGTAKVTKGDEEFVLAENQSTYVPVGIAHRLENPGAIPLEIIEVQSGSYLGEDDIVRFADRYNRPVEAKTPALAGLPTPAQPAPEP